MSTLWHSTAIPFYLMRRTSARGAPWFLFLSNPASCSDWLIGYVHLAQHIFRIFIFKKIIVCCLIQHWNKRLPNILSCVSLMGLWELTALRTALDKCGFWSVLLLELKFLLSCSGFRIISELPPTLAVPSEWTTPISSAVVPYSTCSLAQRHVICSS